MDLLTVRDTFAVWSLSQVFFSAVTFLFCSCPSAEDCRDIWYSTDCPIPKFIRLLYSSAEVKLHIPSTTPAKATLNLPSCCWFLFLLVANPLAVLSPAQDSVSAFGVWCIFLRESHQASTSRWRWMTSPPMLLSLAAPQPWVLLKCSSWSILGPL